jgi:hypothetical protein
MEYNNQQIKIIDNFLGEDLIKHLEEIFLFKTPHYYGHKSHKDSKFFYNCNVNLNDYLLMFLHKKLKDIFKIKEVLRCYINIQFNGMDGDWHQDDGNHTILLMVTKTLKKGSGEFQIKKDNKINKISFIQNRLIFFNSSLKHRGMSPKEIAVPRITLAFKTI